MIPANAGDEPAEPEKADESETDADESETDADESEADEPEKTEIKRIRNTHPSRMTGSTIPIL